jgi:NhaA family Na+:H+ antiporter
LVPSKDDGGDRTRPIFGRRLWQRLLRILQVEASSGLVLLVAALVALACANSPWSGAYDDLWRTPLNLTVGGFSSTATVGFWINDGLMTLFFLVVGLEIRHEFARGTTVDLKGAVLPVAAAAGGMLVPALIYLAVSGAGVARRGWGIPTATDIAFSVGVLALLGKKVPPALRVLLLSLATVDDLGSIAIVSIFYPSRLSMTWLVVAVGGVSGLALLWRLRVRLLAAYLIPGSLVWLGALRAGVPPAIAGVAIGMLMPVERGEGLHAWVAYLVTPLFALANAGVGFRGLALHGVGSREVVEGVLLGRVLGKPAGIMLAAYAVVRAGLCDLPRGVTWRAVLLIGCLGGIGLTVPIYIAGVAFADPALLAAAKFSLLGASVLAAALGVIVGIFLPID